MFKEYRLADFQFTDFVLVNWGFSIFSALLLLLLLHGARYRLLKPSTLILISYHFLMQWPMAFYAPYIETWLPAPWEAAFLIHSFVLIGIVISRLSVERSALVLWVSINRENKVDADSRTRDAEALICIALALLLVYAVYVPFSSTGLYALVANTEDAVQAREESLKLLTSPFPVYAYSILNGSVAPLLGAVLAFRLAKRTVKSRRDLIIASIEFVFISFCVMLNGAKGNMVQLILAWGAAWWLSKGMRLEPIKIALGVVIALMPAVAVAVLFSITDPAGANLTPAEIIGSQIGAIANRAFVVPLEVGIWYMHYAQNFGKIGIAGLERFASFAGEVPVDVPNLIGLYYGPEYYGHPVGQSISATAGFVFANYAYFGLAAVLLNPLCLLICNVLPALTVRMIPPRLFGPVVATFFIAALKFAQSDFLTVWVTHGFLIVLILAWLIGMFQFPSNSRRSIHSI